MYTLLLLTVFAQVQDQPPAPGGATPEQVLASIDAKGKLTITHVTCSCNGPATQDTTVTAQDPKGKEKVAVKVKTSSLVLTTAELPARFVEAHTVDGKTISAETLATLLVKERTVLVSMDGKKIDPFYLQLYKEGTIVLVPPANTLNVGGYVGGYGFVAPPIADPIPRPLPERGPLPPDRKP